MERNKDGNSRQQTLEELFKIAGIKSNKKSSYVEEEATTPKKVKLSNMDSKKSSISMAAVELDSGDDLKGDTPDLSLQSGTGTSSPKFLETDKSKVRKVANLESVEEKLSKRYNSRGRSPGVLSSDDENVETKGEPASFSVLSSSDNEALSIPSSTNRRKLNKVLSSSDEEDVTSKVEPSGFDLALNSDNEVDIVPNTSTRRKLNKIICSSDEENLDISVVELDSDSDLDLSVNLANTNLDITPTFSPEDMVKYYNQATEEELIKLINLTPKMCQLLLETRPFQDLPDLKQKLLARGSGKKVIEKFETLIENFEIVDELVIKSNLYLNQLKNSKRKVKKLVIKDAPQFLSPEILLKGYQIEGINWLLKMFQRNCGVILADEMGLGKTCQVIVTLCKLIHSGVTGPHLVVVPVAVLDNWCNEFEKFCPSVELLVYRGSQRERESMYIDFKRGRLDHFDVLITSYDMASSHKMDRSFLRNLNFQSLVLDEAHTVKNANTGNFQFLTKLEINFRLLLTGTPLQNNLVELINLVSFINPNIFSHFKSRKELEQAFAYFPVDPASLSKFSEMAKDLIQEKITKTKSIMVPYVLRRTKVQVLKDLPTKSEVVVQCPMSTRQLKAYHSLIEEAKKTKLLNHSQLLTVYHKLRRTANHTMLIPNGYHFEDSTKLKIAKEILKEPDHYEADWEQVYQELQEYCDNDVQELCKKYKRIRQFALKDQQWMESGKVQWINDNLPTMTQKFTMVLDILEQVLQTLQLKYMRLDGTTKIEQRQVMIDQFNTDTTIKVFLLSTRSGGTGINLTGANKVIIHDLDHNPQNDRQAEARAHRVGQVRNVTVYKLITKHSVEENILSRTKSKLELHSQVSGEHSQPLDDQSELFAVQDKENETNAAVSIVEDILKKTSSDL